MTAPPPPLSPRPGPLWRRYLAGLLPPLVLIALLLAVLVFALHSRLQAGAEYDLAALREWVSEARVYRATLPELVRDLAESDAEDAFTVGGPLHQHLAALAEAPRLHQGLLPLFPVIYRMEVRWEPAEYPSVVWDARLPYRPGNVERRVVPIWKGPKASALLVIDCQLHAFAQRQEQMATEAARLRTWLSLLAIGSGVVAIGWVALFLRAERRRELTRLEAQQRLDASERQALEAQLARQAAESQALELKSQLYANMGVMAGSYAHNIKNMMVRPSDLLTRCASDDALPKHLQNLLDDVRGSMQAVTDRTEQILRSVRSDPSRVQRSRCDLTEVLAELSHAWQDLAREKWMLDLVLEQPAAGLWIDGDPSQLLQLFENLLFNARDATFEQRGHLRQEARQAADPRAALLVATQWRGRVVIRAATEEGRAVVEVSDNGIGMQPDVQAHCTEPHFTTKRDNALYEGHATGLGLGLAFVTAILESHDGKLIIRSNPGQGTTMRVELPAAPPPPAG
ncbi:MAG TPA: HAMP domain-containing sensor histidine kinase [Gemmatales bacterium]|nr:HAMP domain-containing sensor histidine kinase [Gemmatales bacterium]